MNDSRYYLTVTNDSAVFTLPPLAPSTHQVLP